MLHKQQKTRLVCGGTATQPQMGHRAGSCRTAWQVPWPKYSRRRLLSTHACMLKGVANALVVWWHGSPAADGALRRVVPHGLTWTSAKVQQAQVLEHTCR